MIAANTALNKLKGFANTAWNSIPSTLKGRGVHSAIGAGIGAIGGLGQYAFGDDDNTLLGRVSAGALGGAAYGFLGGKQLRGMGKLLKRSHGNPKQAERIKQKLYGRSPTWQQHASRILGVGVGVKATADFLNPWGLGWGD